MQLGLSMGHTTAAKKDKSAHVDRANVSPPLPEEGHRLIQAFFRIERPDLRERIFNFVIEMLKSQDEGR
jgi:hypothetical protein